jgi:hypothetical protein
MLWKDLAYTKRLSKSTQEDADLLTPWCKLIRFVIPSIFSLPVPLKVLAANPIKLFTVVIYKFS